MNKARVCDCGCGEKVVEGKRFRQGHWSRTKAAKAVFAEMKTLDAPKNPSGLCLCGCGEKTPIAKTSKPSRGYYKGDPLLFIPGHQVASAKGNHRWRGGRWTHKGGYVYVYAPDHPHCNRDKYVYEHRLVMERELGRFLERHEQVHHVNGIKTDNRPENLVVMTRAEHHRHHAKESLVPFMRAHPEVYREAGKKGAAARWAKPPGAPRKWGKRISPGKFLAMFLDKKLLRAAEEFVDRTGQIPDLEALTQEIYGHADTASTERPES